jgi:hypothetical protein
MYAPSGSGSAIRAEELPEKLYDNRPPTATLKPVGSGVIWNGIPPARPVIPAKAEIQPVDNAFLSFADWIPALRQAQAKLFAGMTAAWSFHISQMTPLLAFEVIPKSISSGSGVVYLVNVESKFNVGWELRL